MLNKGFTPKTDTATERLFRKAIVAVKAKKSSRAFGYQPGETSRFDSTVKDVPYEYEKHVTPDIVRRARKAGAKGSLTYVGIGMTSVVLEDARGRCWKVGRNTDATTRGILEDEFEYLQTAGKGEGKGSVVRVFRFHPGLAVIERACVKGMTGRWSDQTRLWDLHHKELSSAMKKRGWLPPEFKEDSYVIDERTNKPVLIDAGFALRRGDRLVEYVDDVLSGRRKSRESRQDMMYAVKAESGNSISVDVADALLKRLEKKEK